MNFSIRLMSYHPLWRWCIKRRRINGILGTVHAILTVNCYLCGLINTLNVKGISYITDSKNRKKAVVIDFKTIEKYDENLEDLFDVILAEARKDEPSSSWDDVKKKLKSKGKL